MSYSKDSTREVTFLKSTPHEGGSRDRLLLLAEKTHQLNAKPSISFSPELRPKMGLRVKDKQRNSMFVSEQSLPDKISQAWKHLRPGALVHSASSSTPFRLKNKGEVAADDVVYISSPEKKANRKSHVFEIEQNDRRDSFRRQDSPSGSDHVQQCRDSTLKDLEQIRNLYKSVPNVSTLEDNDFNMRSHRYNARCFDDIDVDLVCPTRSPTDSGYRSTSRHVTEENPYALDDDHDMGVSHKTTTVVHVNGDTSPTPIRDGIMRVQTSPKTEESQPSSVIGVDKAAFSPLTDRDVITILQGRRCKKYSKLIDLSTVSRIRTLLCDTLLTLTEQVERLSTYTLKITTDTVNAAAKILLPLEVLSSCCKAGSQASIMYALGGTRGLKKSLSQRAELRTPVGRIYRFFTDKIPNRPLSDTVPIYIAALMECLTEEMIHILIKEDQMQVLTNSEFEERIGPNSTLIDFFKRHDKLSGAVYSSFMSRDDLLMTVASIRERIVMETDGSISSAKGKRKLQMTLSSDATRTLLYYMTTYRENLVPLADWTRIMFAFAEHRMTPFVENTDVQQAAYMILGKDCAPPFVQFWRHDVTADCDPEEATTNFAFALIASGRPDNIQHATRILHDKLHGTSAFGLTALAESVVREDEETMRLLLSSGCSVNVGVPKSKAEKSQYLLEKHTGWTPLTWAVAKQNEVLTNILLNSGAELQNDTMIKESPLQVSVQTGNFDLVCRLLDCGADPFRSSIVYNVTQACFRHSGCPSPLALACARGNIRITNVLLDRLSHIDHSTSANDFLRNQANKTEKEGNNEFHLLPVRVRLSLQEALYYAVETSQPEIAFLLRERVSGLPWNMYTWSRCLESAAAIQNGSMVLSLLADFSPQIAADLNEDNINFTLSVLFSLLKSPDVLDGEIGTKAAGIISQLWHFFCPQISNAAGPEKEKPHRPHRAIDASFVNNEHLSDVRFQVDGELIYGHRLLLFNASDKFRKLLQSPQGVIEVTDVSREHFLLMLTFLYDGCLPSTSASSLMNLTTVADLYQLPNLRNEIEKSLSSSLSLTNVGEIYQFAIAHTAPFLRNACEKFMLDNFGSLVTGSQIVNLLETNFENNDLLIALSTRIAHAFYESSSTTTK